jgi:hydroxymethylglutaryl-CoA lyase
MKSPSRVRVVEVGPRDGLQNEHVTIPTAIKVRLIQALIDAGLPEIEIGSFVSPEWVPQLGDAEAVAGAFRDLTTPVLTALVPNEKGMRRAMGAGIRSVAVFTAASETFNIRNTNATIEQSIERFRPVIDLARSAPGVRVRGYVSTAFHCPFEGPVAPEKGIETAARLFGLGCDEVSIGDTIGMATPNEISRFLDAAERDGRLALSRVALHLHDTRGTALANVLAALEAGIAIFDASAGGLGGCPYAPGAGGNLATEDLLHMLHGMGIETGVSLDRVVEASGLIEPHLSHPLPSKAYRADRAARAVKEGSSPVKPGRCIG